MWALQRQLESRWIWDELSFKAPLTLRSCGSAVQCPSAERLQGLHSLSLIQSSCQFCMSGDFSPFYRSRN